MDHQALSDHQDLRDPTDKKETLEHLDYRDSLAPMVGKGRRELEASQERKEKEVHQALDYLVPKGRKEILEQLGHRERSD